MVNMFGKSLFGKSLFAIGRPVSKRKANRRAEYLACDVETLETRQVLTVNVLFQGGSLYLTSSAGDDPTITFNAGATNVHLSGAGTTYVGNSSGDFLVTGSIYVTMDGGDNAVTLNGTGVFAGNVTINLGNGTNSVTVSGSPTVRDLTITGGTGAETETIGTLTARSININNGTGDSTVTATTGVVSTTGAFSITNGTSAGAQSVTLGAAANAVTIGAALTINQGAATTHGISLTNTHVTGNVSLTNGTGTGHTTVTLSDLDATANLSVVNGNLTGVFNNSVSLSNSAASTSDILGNVAIQNGTTSGTNTITVDGSNIGAAGRSHNFTNKASANSTVTFNGTAASTANTVTGPLVISNTAIAAGGTNHITVGKGTFTGSVSLTNSGDSVGNANTINVGQTAAGGAAIGVVTYNGNWSLSNGKVTAGNTNQVGISGLQVAVGGGGSVSITNGTTGGTGSNILRLGEFDNNVIAGGLAMTNTVSGERTTFIDQTSVAGAAGITITHSGAGTSVIALGVNAPSVDITGGSLTISDGGTGTATSGQQSLRAEDLHVAANFLYTGTGTADDYITIGNNSQINPGDPPRVSVGGTTVINTGAGNDTVFIGAAASSADGDADFTGQLRVVLGAGTDNLTVSSVYSGGIANSLTNFSFDGGSGVDVWTIAVLPPVAAGIADPAGYRIDVLTDYMAKRLLSFEGPNIVN